MQMRVVNLLQIMKVFTLKWEEMQNIEKKKKLKNTCI